jgi:hypothetical protein
MRSALQGTGLPGATIFPTEMIDATRVQVYKQSITRGFSSSYQTTCPSSFNAKEMRILSSVHVGVASHLSGMLSMQVIHRGSPKCAEYPAVAGPGSVLG